MDQLTPSAMEKGSTAQQECQDTKLPQKVASEDPAPDRQTAAAQIETRVGNTGKSSQPEMRDTNVEVFQHRALNQNPASAVLRKLTLHVIESTPSVAVENDGVVVLAPAVVKEGVFVVGPADGAEVEFKEEPEDPPESMSNSDSDETEENFYFPQPFVLPKTEFLDENQSEKCDNVNNGESKVNVNVKVETDEKNKLRYEVSKATHQLETLRKANSSTSTRKTPEKKKEKNKEKRYSEKERLDRRHLRSAQKLRFLNRQLKELETSEDYIQAKKNPDLKENVTRVAFMNYFKGLSPDFQMLTPKRKETYLSTFGQCIYEQIEQELAETE